MVDIDRAIRFTEAEQRALQFDQELPAEVWPLEMLDFLEEFVRIRITEKQLLLDEARMSGQLGRASEELFRTKSEVNVLESAHEDMMRYAFRLGADVPPENS